MQHRSQFSRLPKVFFLLMILGSFNGTIFSDGQKEITVRVVQVPPTSGRNDFYVGNRSPLLPSPLFKLPIGSVRPDGWLRHQLELMAGGFSGHLAEISKWCKYDGSAWANSEGQGQYGWEELPYWLKGFIDLGYVLRDDRIIAEARRWVEGVLSSQDATGYFGPRVNRDKHDLWPNMVMLYVLRAHYEATEDARVIPFMTRYFRWLTTVPLEHYLPGSWQKWRGADNLDHIYWLYNHTGPVNGAGEPWLLDLARLNHERTADWVGGIPTWHGVNLCQGFREPAQYYQQAYDIRYLRATERNYDSIMTTYGQVPGGMFGADENCRPGFTGPRQAAETCSMVEFMHSFEMLLKITGDPIWAERCENVAFNSLPAAMTADVKGLHYLTAPNMVQLDIADKSPLLENGGDMLSYNPWQYRCCQHNVAFGWPYFAEHLWMATQGNGIAAVFYGRSSVNARVADGVEVRIDETTDYPFDEVVEFRFSMSKQASFPFVLRVPGWCKGAGVKVNGETIKLKAGPSSWIVLERNWQNNDVVSLELPMEISVTVWKKNMNAVSVHRGPLTYSLRIDESWVRYGSSNEWPAFQVFPTTPWNYGLVVDVEKPAVFFEVVKEKGLLPAQPFTLDAAPIQLVAKGRRIPQWKLEPNGLVGEVQENPVRSDQPVEKIALIPMGCARLRISAFPHIGEGTDARMWK